MATRSSSSLLIGPLVVATATGCVSAYDPAPGDPRPVLTAVFGSDYSGSEVGRFRPRGRYAVQLSCPAGNVAVTLTAGDEPLVELDLSCTARPRQEFDLDEERTVQVTLTALSANAEGRAYLYRVA